MKNLQAWQFWPGDINGVFKALWLFHLIDIAPLRRLHIFAPAGADKQAAVERRIVSTSHGERAL